MAAFVPGPSASPVALANWLFVRLTVLAALTVFVAAVASGLLGPVIGMERTVLVRAAVSLVGLWIGLQLLFAALEGYVEARLERE